MPVAVNIVGWVNPCTCEWDGQKEAVAFRDSVISNNVFMLRFLHFVTSHIGLNSAHTYGPNEYDVYQKMLLHSGHINFFVFCFVFRALPQKRLKRR